MSIRSVKDAASSGLRNYALRTFAGQGGADSPYSTASRLALLLIVGLTVKLVH